MKFARAAGDTCIISRNFTFMSPSRAQTLRALYALGDLSGITFTARHLKRHVIRGFPIMPNLFRHSKEHLWVTAKHSGYALNAEHNRVCFMSHLYMNVLVL